MQDYLYVFLINKYNNETILIPNMLYHKIFLTAMFHIDTISPFVVDGRLG